MKVLEGIRAAPGLAIGSAHIIRPAPAVDIMEQRTMDAPGEISRLERATEQAIARLDRLRSAASGDTAGILEAQREMLDDPELKQGADALIEAGFTAGAAIVRVTTGYAEQLASLPDPYLPPPPEEVRGFTRLSGADRGGFRREGPPDSPRSLSAQRPLPAHPCGQV